MNLLVLATMVLLVFEYFFVLKFVWNSNIILVDDTLRVFLFVVESNWQAKAYRISDF